MAMTQKGQRWVHHEDTLPQDLHQIDGIDWGLQFIIIWKLSTSGQRKNHAQRQKKRQNSYRDILHTAPLLSSLSNYVVCVMVTHKQIIFKSF